MDGSVQGVGYRALVKQIARRKGLNGKVKNLPDGSVEIYCEGDKDSILGFVEAIDIKSKDTDNVFALNVEKIDVFWEDEEGYVSIKEEFRPFESDYGEEAKTPIEKANLERLEIGSLMILDLGQKMAGVGTKVSDVGAEVKGVREEVRGVRTEVKDVRAEVRGVRTEVKEGFSATHGDFEELDGKYDVVSKELKSINKNISKLVDHLGTIIEQFTENKKKKENLE